MKGSRSRSATLAALATFVLAACASDTAEAQAASGFGIPGPNVNIIGPTPNPAQIPDKTFKQQNEPACTVQPDNLQNVFCAYNDYRGVDISAVGDAWIGASLSRNGGDTWTSRLVPSFPGDTPTISRPFAADPGATAVPGMVLLSFIAASRDVNAPGGIYLQRWLEVNKEDGAPWEPLDTLPITVGTSGQFVDKPATLVTLRNAAPVPTTLATGVTRNLVPGEIHIAYANFSGNDSRDSASIYYTKSTDYGLTWSNKNKLSESISLNQGVVLAANGDTVLAVWRQFDKNNNQPDSFAYAISTNRGDNWSKPQAIPLPPGSVCPFEQPSALPDSNYAFRTEALPVAVSDGKRFYLFWAQRKGDCLTGPSRIAYLSTNGTTWDAAPTFVDPDDAHPAAHQVMPAAFAAGGVIEVAWYDTRDDEYWGGQTPLYSPYIVDTSGTATDADGKPINVRHTADTYHAQIVDGVSKGSVKVSQYAEGDFNARGDGRPLERNYVNGRMFAQATRAFIGDYISATAPAFRLAANGLWVSNQSKPAVADVAPAAPTFHVAWADNRDVRSNVYQQSACAPGAAPGSAGCPGASAYTPTFQGEVGSNATGTCQPDFDATTAPDQLNWTPGGSQQSLKALSRNQNVYAAFIKPGLVFGTSSASKPTDIQRAFVMYVQNTDSNSDQTFDLKLSPVYPSGVIADPLKDRVSFQQSQSGVPLQALLVPVPAGSSAARTVFVTSTSGKLQARVDAFKVTCTNPADVTTCSETLAASIVLNGNPSADSLKNPDCKGAGSCVNADVTLFEAHNPDISAGFYSVQNPSYRNPSLRNPSLRNAVYENPSLRNQTVQFPSLRNPSLRNAPLSDSDAQAQTYTDFVYNVANSGNTTSAYNLKPLITGDMTDPTGKPLYFPQLIVSRVYDEETAQNCNAVTINRQQVIVNIQNPDVAAAPGPDPLADPGLGAGARHATFFAEPGGKLQITLRVWGVDAAKANPEFRNRVWMKVYSQALNTDGAFGKKLSYDYVGCTGCTTPDVTKPVFAPDPGFPLYSPQPANVPFQVAANQPGGWLANYRDPLVTDDSGAANVAVSCSPRGVVLGVGPQSVVCTATDKAGNSSSIEYRFAVTDDVPPVVTVTLPPGVAGGVEATSASGAVVSFDAVANDFVNGPRPVSCTPASGSTFPIGATQVTCTASDPPRIQIGSNPDVYTGGTTGSYSFSITVKDATAPAVTTAPANVTAEATSAAGAVVTYTTPVFTDAVGVTSTTCTPLSGSTFAIGNTTVTCKAKDAAGNEGTATFTVTVKDTKPPPFVDASGNPLDLNNLLPPITAEATGPTGAVVIYTPPMAKDIVDGFITPVCTPPSGSAFPVGSSTVTCVATDSRGNATTGTFTVIVRDTTPPTVTVPANVSAEATGPNGATVSFSVAASDIVDGSITPNCTPASGGTFSIATTTVNCSAKDKAGNTGTASFTVTVKDTTKPVVTPPANVIAEATSAAGASVTYGAAIFSDAVGVVTKGCTPASGSTFGLGATIVTCTATDAANNTGSATFTVTVQDTTAPTLTVPASVVAEATSASGAVVTYSASATDLVSGAITPVCAPTSGSTFPVGSSAVNCTATDAKGNSSSKSFAVTVQDTTAPKLTVPASVIAEATSAAGAVVTYSASATDLVSGAITPTCAPASGSTFALGAATVTCTAKDAKGNTGTASFTVTVQDTTPPGLTVPANITTSTTGTTKVVSYTVTATDNVGVATLACSSTSTGVSGVSTTGGTFPLGTSTVSCTATDTKGLKTTKSFTVTVNKDGYWGLDGVYANSTKSINSSVPLDFGFTGSTGSRVDSAAAQPVVTVYFSGAKTCGTSTGTLIASYPGSSDYRYSTSGFNWQFNWKTNGLATGCYQITVTSNQYGQTFQSKNTVTLTK